MDILRYQTSFDIIEHDLETLSCAATQLRLLSDDDARSYALTIVAFFGKFNSREQITELLVTGSAKIHDEACNFINNEIKRIQQAFDYVRSFIVGSTDESEEEFETAVYSICSHLDGVLSNNPEICELANDYSNPLAP